MNTQINIVEDDIFNSEHILKYINSYKDDNLYSSFELEEKFKECPYCQSQIYLTFIIDDDSISWLDEQFKNPKISYSELIDWFSYKFVLKWYKENCEVHLSCDNCMDWIFIPVLDFIKPNASLKYRFDKINPISNYSKAPTPVIETPILPKKQTIFQKICSLFKLL